MENTLETRKIKKDTNVNFIRCMSCIAVIGLHTFKRELSITTSTLYYMCGYAVPFFFMSSGFFLLIRDRITKKYAIKKSIRILRLVLIWNIIFWAASIVLNVLTKKEEVVHLTSVFYNIVCSLIQKGPLWHFWYFAALILVYFFLSVDEWIQKSKVSRRKVIFCTWLGFCGIGVILQILSTVIFHMPVQKKIIQTFRLWTWMQYILLGGLIHIKKEKCESIISFKSHFTLTLLATLIAIVYQTVNGKYFIHETHAEYFYDSPIIVIWSFISFSFLLRISFSDKLSGIIDKIAPLTLGIYIIHPILLKVIDAIWTVDTIVDSIILFISTTFFSFLIIKIIDSIPIVKKLVKM